MIQKTGNCNDCGNFRPINSKGICPDCVFKSTHDGKTRQEVYFERNLAKEKMKTIKPLPKRKTIKKPPKNKTGELEMFIEIWEEREHICSNKNCNKHLGDELNIQYFSHRKSKGAYPELRLVKENTNLS